MSRSKQFVRPQKKAKPKFSTPDTADEFQEAADREEETGGKWRAGDTTKSTRAFVRALDLYDKGLARHPSDFDLAYNKARLQLEISQQPALVDHVGLPLLTLLQQTLDSHRFALKLRQDNPDVLFNASQVLVSLAELHESEDPSTAIVHFQEALELLSACLSRQEILLEQQRVDFDDAEASDENGGVEIEPADRSASGAASSDVRGEETATIEIPVSPTELLDTTHASVSALAALVTLSEPHALQTLGDMAQSLTEEKAPQYVSLLPAEEQPAARLNLLLDRAVFVAALADAQFRARQIEWKTLLDRLEVSFAIPGKDESAHALTAEAEARVEAAQSALDDSTDSLTSTSSFSSFSSSSSSSSSSSRATMCWDQLNLAQNLYSQATKLTTQDANERKATVYRSKGDLELLRHGLAVSPQPGMELDAAIKRSGSILAGNAAKFYKGAAQLARRDGDEELEVVARARWLIALKLRVALYDIEATEWPYESGMTLGREEQEAVTKQLGECMDEGILNGTIARSIMK